MQTRHRPLLFALALAAVLAAQPSQAQTTASIPQVGEQAPAVTLPGLDGQPVDLASFFDDGKTVLVVLRGYPGYQCGICTRQVTGFFAAAPKFEKEGLKVVMIYPGAAADLSEHAEEFLAGKTMPAGFTMLLDPDYKFTDKYGLRWMAPNETAYPATFIVAEGGEIAYAEISDSHGGRIEAKDALAAAAD